MLQLNHIKKTYNKTEVLTDVNYTFEENRIYPILGGPGSGRTTLFECMCDDMTIDSGSIEVIYDKDLKKKQTVFLAAKQSILPMYITGYEFIKYLCELNKNALEPEEYLNRVDFDETLRNTLICNYSFENKKRLQLAAFLVQRPYVIIFDEALDYCSDEYVDMFLRVLNEEKENHIILISTGQLDMALRIYDEFLVLSNGEFNEVSKKMLDIPEIKNAIKDILGETDNDIF